MPHRKPSFVALLTLGTIAVVVASAPWVRAKDEPPRPSMAAQKKVDHPFLKSLLGTWDWTSKTDAGQEGKGSETFRLGLLDTAVFDDVEGTVGTAFQGHGVWKLSPDGASLTWWWLSSADAAVKVYRGTISADGCDVTGEGDERITLRKTGDGLEMKAYRGETVLRTVTYVKR